MPTEKWIIKKLFNAKTALFAFTIFIIAYIIILDVEGAFNEKFLMFGPGTTEDNKTKFLNIELDTWPKVILLYVVGFMSALLTTYYKSVMKHEVHTYIWNKHTDDIPVEKWWVRLIIMMEPFFFQILSVVQFFTNMTMQLQFIIPQFLGGYLAEVPYTLHVLNTKEFKKK